MRAWRHSFISVALGLALGALGTLSAQERPPTVAPPVKPEVELPQHPFQRLTFLSARQGAEWLCRTQRADGLFQYGLVPSLGRPLDGDHYLHQAVASVGLARAARVLQHELATARARQAVLSLLALTKTDPSAPQVRYPAFPSSQANRLGTSGLLVLAIHELPEPGEDLLEQSEQLCNFIRGRQQADGSFKYQDDLPQPVAFVGTLEEDADAFHVYPGMALCGLMRSQLHRPADWKTDTARKALGFYRTVWQKQKHPALAAWHTPAYVEAFVRTKEKAFAELAIEMADWLTTLQYDNDRQNLLWTGGFKSCREGVPLNLPPRVTSSIQVTALIEAYRAVRQTGDATRTARYRDAIERGLQFLASLQYTAGTTRHFAESFQPRVIGGFHPTHQDGTLRIDATGHTVAALTHYLQHVAELPARR